MEVRRVKRKERGSVTLLFHIPTQMNEFKVQIFLLLFCQKTINNF